MRKLLMPAATILLLTPALLAAQNLPPVQIIVIGTAPLPGIERSRDEIPSSVQTATPQDLEKIAAPDLSNFLNRRFDGVHANEIQGNPFQADVSFRGYTASPLLGTPQGLSVYMDGVRLNQPFGDVVSWDSIPRIAIASTTLMPGSNPLFGLNTLGGALSIQTKDGSGKPGGSFQTTIGSHARRGAELEYGDALRSGTGRVNWYVAGNRFGERGWRRDSSSDIRQGFGKLGWTQGGSMAGLTVAYAKNTLLGSALQEQSLLAQDYADVYTRPDITRNRSVFVNVSGRHAFTANLLATGNVYYRNIRTSTLNADINEGSLDQPVYQPSADEQAALASAGYSGFPTGGASADNTPFPFWRCIGNVLRNDEPGKQCNGLVNRTGSLQRNAGMSGQVATVERYFGRLSQLTFGAAYDRSGVAFDQSTELGYLNPDRSVTGMGVFADGVSGGTVDGEPFDTRVGLDGHVHTWSLFATDTYAVARGWSVTLSGRFNRTSVHNEDRITPGGGSGSLDGDYLFSRFNPALGVTFSPKPQVNLYFGYGEGSRAPTSIELGCADPDRPCKLPNAMSGDPPLDQVTTQTWELGIRNGRDSRWNWNAGLFLASNRNDILFAASTQTGFGYFKNFGATRRQGFDASLGGKVRTVGGGIGYTFLSATYRSAETVLGSGNSTNDTAEGGVKGLEGAIDIHPGDRIPLIPRHIAKLFVEIQATKRLSFDLDVMAIGRSFARGNENNLHEPDAGIYPGAGTSPGYGVVNLGLHYKAGARLQFNAQVNNLLNHRYSTAAQLGPTGITANGNFIAQPFPAVGGEFPLQYSTFYAPGAPVLFTFGTKLKL